MTKLNLPTEEPDITKWIGSFSNSIQARVCVRYALVFNTLSIQWLEDYLSESVTYSSQSVGSKSGFLEILEGKNRVWEYLSEKTETLRSLSNRRPRAELGTAIPGAKLKV